MVTPCDIMEKLLTSIEKSGSIHTFHNLVEQLIHERPRGLALFIHVRKLVYTEIYAILLRALREPPVRHHASSNLCT